MSVLAPFVRTAMGHRGGFLFWLVVVGCSQESGLSPVPPLEKAPRILYTRADGLYYAHVDGTDERRFAAGTVASACWSPDGAQIAWAADDENGHPSIFVANRDGRARRVVVSYDYLRQQRFQAVEGLTWSLDDRIAFGLTGAAGTSPEIHIAQAGAADQAGKLLDNATSPAWSPDGMRLAFSEPGPMTQQLGILDAAGQKRVIEGSGAKTTRSLKPAWLPDGEWIIDNAYWLTVFQVDGPNTNDLDFTSVLGLVPLLDSSPSPDGMSLAATVAGLPLEIDVCMLALQGVHYFSGGARRVFYDAWDPHFEP
jgi:WD40-like Beta Propeller Repeat